MLSTLIQWISIICIGKRASKLHNEPNTKYMLTSCFETLHLFYFFGTTISLFVPNQKISIFPYTVELWCRLLLYYIFYHYGFSIALGMAKRYEWNHEQFWGVWKNCNQWHNKEIFAWIYINQNDVYTCQSMQFYNYDCVCVCVLFSLTENCGGWSTLNAFDKRVK